MKDGEHYHNQGDPEGKHNHRKLAGIILLAVISALVAYGVAQTALDTANTNNIFAIVVNNTDLYPTQRTNHTVYWANESPIAVYILFHAIDVATPQHFDSNFTINGSIVLDKDFNSAAGSGAHEHWSFYTIVPKGANYSVTNSTNVYQIEWREYPILSGKNGTLSLNQTFVMNGSSFNATYEANISALQANDTYFNSSVFNQSKSFRNDSVNDTIIRNYTIHHKTGVFARDTTLASGTQSVTGIGFKPSSVTFFMTEKGTGEASWGTCTNGQSEALYKLSGGSTYWENSGNCIFDSQLDPTNLYSGTITMEADGFTVSWTKTGSPTGTITILYTAYR